jgi:hypothetical protein
VYDVHLVIIPPDGQLEEIEEVLAGATFQVEVEDRDDGMLGIWCLGIKSSGISALPEALRLAQVGISVPLKHAYPVFANRGGLLWSDVVSAEVRATI